MSSHLVQIDSFIILRAYLKNLQIRGTKLLWCEAYGAYGEQHNNACNEGVGEF